jgi:hypothetical protein
MAEKQVKEQVTIDDDEGGDGDKKAPKKKFDMTKLQELFKKK